MHLTGSRRCQPSHWSARDSLSNRLKLAVGQRLTCPLPGASTVLQMRMRCQQANHTSATLPVQRAAEPPDTAHPGGATRSWVPCRCIPCLGTKAQSSSHRTSYPLSAVICALLLPTTHSWFSSRKVKERRDGDSPKPAVPYSPSAQVRERRARHRWHRSHRTTTRSI